MVRSLIVRFVFLVAPTAICASGYAQIPPIPSNTQRSIERIVGISGAYATSESTLHCGHYATLQNPSSRTSRRPLHRAAGRGGGRWLRQRQAVSGPQGDREHLLRRH